MNINFINLVNFRSYQKSRFEFGKRTLIVGVNGAGKSNILEAIYLLATGKSFRADTESEMLRYEQPVATIECTTEIEEGQLSLRITITDGSLGYGRKKFVVNGVPRRQMDAVGKLRAVLFSPADIELVTGSPSHRRRYLDFVIGQTDREYRRSVLAYEKGLRQRNKLLDLIRDGFAQRTQLFFWDRVLIKNGQYITDKRREFLDLSGFTYDKSVISEQRLQQYEVEEVAAGSTLVGPHRDDFIFIMKAPSTKHQEPNNNQLSNSNDQTEYKDVKKFGSRGEQRMAVWWLKQKEIEYLDGKPVLLLDDIFSELDAKHKLDVVAFMQAYEGQVVMTTAEGEAKTLFNFDTVIEL